MNSRAIWSKRAMSFSAAAMFAAAGAVATLESALPGGTVFSPAPGFAALVAAAVVALGGPRAPRALLSLIGPIGAVMIASTLATTASPGDGAALYIWPVLWSSFFFGRRGAVAIVLTIAVAHAIGLTMHDGPTGSIDRWIDVMVSVSVAAALVSWLSHRNAVLVEDLEAEARIDALTGLLNRRGFEERAAIEFARAEREQEPIAATAFDIDYFKRVNDEWGHETGDRVLATLGEIFRSRTREIDVAGRLGGEEFVVLMSGVGAEEARAYAEQIRAAFGERGGGPAGRVTLSAGVASTPAGSRAESGELMHRADSALYRAKAAGRDRVVTASIEVPPAPVDDGSEPLGEPDQPGLVG